MAASASNTTTVQYPIWIDGDKIYCDEAKLADHLTQKLNYNENGAARVSQQITGHIKYYGTYSFWESAAENVGAEAIRVLLHSIEHSQLIYLLSYQDEYEFTAIHWCATYRCNEVIKVILDSVSEDECCQLLSITDDKMRWTSLHMSCWVGDTESVRVMLSHVNQEMRYSLLQMRDINIDTPLHLATCYGHTDIMKAIHESVTQTQWIHLLQIKAYRKMTVLQKAVYWNKQSSIDTIRESVSYQESIQLLATPLPEYDWLIHDKKRYKQVVSWIDEMRAEARVVSALQTANDSSMLSSQMNHTGLTDDLQ